MRLRTVDLFCGAGGSSAGARMAGAEIVGAIDADPIAAATFRSNFPEAKVLETRLDDRNGPGLFGEIGPVDLLLASPECTNHSVARGSREINPESLRSGLYVLPFLEAWKPEYLVIENVSRMRRWEAWKDFLEALETAGYRYSVVVLDAQHYGVPQSRRRLFLMASRNHEPPNAIPVRREAPKSVATILDPAGTHIARSVTKRTKPLATATLERIARGRAGTPEDKDFIIVYYGSDAAGGWQPLTRPLRTLTTLDRFGLVSGSGENATLRMLQIPEIARAMGFPADYSLPHGTRRDRIRLLGNAVCPPVMASVVEALVSSPRATSIPTLFRHDLFSAA